jgi:hypothetical protein
MKILFSPSIALKVLKELGERDELSPRDCQRLDAAIRESIDHAVWMIDTLNKDSTSSLYLYLIEKPGEWDYITRRSREGSQFFMSQVFPGFVSCSGGSVSMNTSRLKLTIQELATFVEQLQEQFDHLEHGL